MRYEAPMLYKVGSASTLIQGPVGIPFDPGTTTLKMHDTVPSKLEEE